MINLCCYKNIFGKPNTGLHKYRIFNIAIVDVLLVIIAAIIITGLWYKFSQQTKKQKKKQVYKVFAITLISLFILGVVVHKLFCVDTTINKLL